MDQRFLSGELEEEVQREEEARQREAARRLLLHPVTRVQQEAALIGNRLEPEVVDTLMRQLEKGEGSRTNPKWMEPQEREALLGQLIRQAKTQKRRRRVWLTLYGVSITLYISLTLSYVFNLFRMASIFPPFLMIFYAIMAAYARRSEKRWGQAARRMAQFDDVRAAGPLMEVLDIKQPDMVFVAEQALIGLLSRLQASDAEGISPAQRECLYRRLKPQRRMRADAEFVLAALKALEQIGDARAIPCVEALAANDTTARHSPSIRDAAQHCLTFLQMRVEQQQYSASLLRASSNAVAPSDHLLRPAEGNITAVDAEQLLRSSNQK